LLKKTNSYLPTRITRTVKTEIIHLPSSSRQHIIDNDEYWEQFEEEELDIADDLGDYYYE